MKFTATPVSGVSLIEWERIEDARGFFARSFCRQEFERQGLTSQFVQGNVSWNTARGTLRGIHYQTGPHAEAKIVRCTRGAVYDVAVDLRLESATYGTWVGVELTARNDRMLYIPEGCGHGYQTLEPDTEVTYLVSAMHAPGHEGGVAWNDPTLNIPWPVPDPIMSDRDRSHQPLQRCAS